MPRSLEELHKVLLQLTLILLHVITYGFIIWSVLCHHGIIDCADRPPAACACNAVAEKLAPPQAEKSGKTAPLKKRAVPVPPSSCPSPSPAHGTKGKRHPRRQVKGY